MQLRSKRVRIEDLTRMKGRYKLCNLYVIGGLVNKGWTTHDIDLATDVSPNEAIRVIFMEKFGLPTYVKTRPWPPYVKIGEIWLVID